MIKEDYVSFETAKLLEEKGYEGDFDGYYNNAGYEISRPNPNLKNYHYYKRPSLYCAMKWLREVYNIHNEIRYFPLSNIYRYVIIYSPASFKNIDSHPLYFNTYEEACEAAIKYCLENLI